MNGLRRNDSLAGMTAKQIFTDCIWLSTETKETKIMLLCISRFMDKDLRNCSMSYAQIARDCSLSDHGAINAAQAARDRWLQIEKGKGRLTPNGRQNLYHGIVPPNLVAELRTRKAKGLTTPTDEKIVAVANAVAEVHGMHPDGVTGVNVVHLDGVHGMQGLHGMRKRGAPDADLLSRTRKEERGAPAQPGEVTQKANNQHANDKRAMMAVLGGEAAYAERNITVLPSGKLVIGDDFRAELRQAFTDEQIEGGVDCTLAAMRTDRNKIKILAQVRRQCTFKRDNDKAAATRGKAFGGVPGNRRSNQDIKTFRR
jgi:hypothetical protein